MSEPLVHRLAEFASRTRPGSDPLAMMRLSLFDWAACGIAGAAEPVSTLVRRIEAASGGTAEASVIGGAGGLPARAAALVNGTTSHALDYDDTHFAHIGHPSVAIIPAAMAIAEARGRTGLELLTASLVGAELSVRVGQWLGRAHYQTGFHQTATAGAFGATAAAGRLLGLAPDAMAQALSLVSTRAAGLKSQFGTMGKPYNAGIAAEAGVASALLAEAGFISNLAALDGPQGFGPTHAGEDATSSFDDLGSAWVFTQISHKFHACCHGLHSMLEAFRGLSLAPEAVDRVTITTHPRWLTVCNQPEPQTGLGAKFSYRLTAAMAMAGWNTAALDSYTEAACRDPLLVGLRDRVSVIGDDKLTETAVVIHLDAAGRSHQLTHDLAAPLAFETRTDKLRHKASTLLGANTAEALWHATAGAAGPNLGDLGALLRDAPTAQGRQPTARTG